jgi:glutamyl-tRNA reductase
LNRLEGKMNALPPEARSVVDDITRLIVEKLLLAPTAQLKALPDEETQLAYTEAVNRLFELREDARGASASEEIEVEPQTRTRS